MEFTSLRILYTRVHDFAFPLPLIVIAELLEVPPSDQDLLRQWWLDLISAVIGAANRDPGHFNTPGRFDVLRHPNRYLAFGQGMHFYLGAPLARTEARLALEQILNRLPGLRMESDVPDWRLNTFMRDLERLSLVG